ncbi:dehydrogenase/reductase (SDR family) member 7Cb isoform X2 [Engraulis encrasicolus]|uniref:dehydrogenase/reductase (SDR family) member 7Cb isoform X2 n=1 Tax=Engraulis encrasicolus TaxID=184585 RepID=UPI002FD6F179
MMDIPSSMALPIVVVVVVVAGIVYIYNEVKRFMSKSTGKNKVVVITDAVSVMGTEVARTLHKGGARLVLCGPSWDMLESLQDSLCAGADPKETFTPKLVLLDLCDTASMPDAAADIVDCYGCVDVMILNSSMKIKAPVQNLSLEMDRNIMDMNYFSPITLVKGVLPSMISRRGGHFLLVNSIQGRLSVPFRTSYAASKHAIQAFFDCLRAEVEEYGIAVSTISHTFIKSTQQEADLLSAHSSLASSPTPSLTTPDATAAEAPADATPPPPPTPPAPAPSSTPVVPTLSSSSLLFVVIVVTTVLKSILSRFCFRLSHGVTPQDLAQEIVRTVDWRRREVLLAHPIPQVALFLRQVLPSAFFSVVAAGVKDGAMAELIRT